MKEVIHHSHLGELKMRSFAEPEDAPNYVKEGSYKGARLIDVVVVENGTERGNATVDLVFDDENGNKYVAMIMGSAIHAIKALVGDIK